LTNVLLPAKISEQRCGIDSRVIGVAETQVIIAEQLR